MLKTEFSAEKVRNGNVKELRISFSKATIFALSGQVIRFYQKRINLTAVLKQRRKWDFF